MEAQATARLAYSAQNCSVSRALEIIGEKWSLLILREAFFGLSRYEHFQQALGCARNLLSARLVTLVEHGLLEKIAYRRAGQRARFEYTLSKKGKDALPIVISLLNWGDRWLSRADERPLIVRHRSCGGRVSAQLVCSKGHFDLALADVVTSPGPGAVKQA